MSEYQSRWTPGDFQIDQHGAYAVATPWISEDMNAFDVIIVDDQEQEKASPKKMVSAELVAGDLKGLVAGETTCTGLQK